MVDGTEDRVLILAPTGHDAGVLVRTLSADGIRAVSCPTPGSLADAIRQGAGAAIVADEALGPRDRPTLDAALDEQPEWSELPIIVMATRGAPFGRGWAFLLESARASQVILLERPVHTATLLSAVRSALRSRSRQYQDRDELDRRRQAEEALRQSEARYRTLFESIDEGFCILEMIFDASGKGIDQRFLETNPAFERHTGLIDARGKTARQLVPDLEDHWPEAYGRVASTGVPARFEDHSAAMGRWFEVDAFPIGDPPNRRVGLLFTDITARKQAELALQESQRQESQQRRFLEALLDNAQACIAVLRGHELRFTLVNPAYQALRPEVEMAGRSYEEVFPEAAAGAPSRLRRVLETGEPLIEHGFHGPIPGKPEARWDHQLIRLPSAEGEEPSVLVIAWDSTDRWHAGQVLVESRRQAEAANRAKSEFLANMSHEIRTPMTAILGYADILAARLVEPDDLDCVETIRRNGRFLIQIINDILDLSKIEAGKLAIQPERFMPHRVVEEVRSLMDVRAREKGLPLRIEYDGPIPETIESDPTRLRQVLINLVGNAIKFTEAGEVRVVVRADPDRQRLGFEVKDSGIGLSAEQQGQLFRPFSQADGGMARRFGGTGLGLVICKRLIEMLGGQIAVQSAPGVGSTFSFAVATGPVEGVPLVEPPGEFAPGPSEPADRPPRIIGRVLVVDDRPEIRAVARHFLEQAGVEVLDAADGEHALDAIARDGREGRPIDAVVLDVQMPGMDGFETVSRLRKRGFDRPVVALTAHAMEGDRDRILDAGFDDHLAKPIDGEQLVRVVGRWIRQTPARAKAPGASRSGPPAPDASNGKDDMDSKYSKDGKSRGHRILLIEDSDDARKVMARLLRMSGHDVRTAPDGRSALDAAIRDRPGVVVLDLGLPDIDGFDLARRLRDSAGLADALLIALTGRGEGDDRDRARAAGIDHYLVKPADAEAIEALLPNPPPGSVTAAGLPPRP